MTITVLVQRQTMPCIKVSIFETFIQGRKYETGLPKSYDPIYREREKRCLKSYRKLSECRHHMHLGNRWLSQGNFEWAMRTYVGLKALKGRYKNFTLGVHTVISNFNVNDFENIYKFVRVSRLFSYTSS